MFPCGYFGVPLPYWWTTNMCIAINHIYVFGIVNQTGLFFYIQTRHMFLSLLSFSFLDWVYYLHELKKTHKTKQTKKQPRNQQKQTNKNPSVQQQKERPPWCSHQHEQIMLCLTTSCIHKKGRGLWLLVPFPLYLKINSLKDLKEKANINANNKWQTLSRRNRACSSRNLWIIQFRAVLFVLFKNM